MVRLSLIATLLVTALVLAAGCGGDDETEVPPGAIAVVDGNEIPKSEFDALMAQAKKSYEQGEREFPKAGTPEYQNLKNNAVQFLVEREQFQLAAEEMDVEVGDEDVDKRLSDLKAQLFKGNQKRYEQALKQAGRSEAAIREDVRAQLVQEEVAERLTQDINVTGAEVEKYYKEHLSDYRTPESREIRHILLSVCGGPQSGAGNSKDCQPAGQAQQLAVDIRQRLENGESFAALAKQHSDDPGSKATGGKLTVNKGATVPEFDKAAFSLGRNVLSQPVKTDYGFHLIEPLSAIRPAKTTPLSQLRSQIRTQLVSQKRSEALSKWVEETKKEYGERTHYQVGYQPPRTATATAGQ
jgi:peptidyl-prolyl cis-trans isomerase C